MTISAHAQEAAVAILKLEKPSQFEIIKAVQSAIDKALENPLREAESATRLFAQLSEAKQKLEQDHSEIVADLQNEILMLRNS
jgi:formiminotetrahydrofolate cyclodeaminase